MAVASGEEKERSHSMTRSEPLTRNPRGMTRAGPNRVISLEVGRTRASETTEAPMQPVYALMSLEALASNPVLPEVMVPTWAPAEPGGDAAASDASPFMTDGSGEPAAFA